jgi:hypothetical protein
MLRERVSDRGKVVVDGKRGTHGASHDIALCTTLYIALHHHV